MCHCNRPPFCNCDNRRLSFLRQIDSGNDQLSIRAADPGASLFIADDKRAVCVEFFGLTAADSF